MKKINQPILDIRVCVFLSYPFLRQLHIVVENITRMYFFVRNDFFLIFILSCSLLLNKLVCIPGHIFFLFVRVSVCLCVC